jgi:N-acetylglucosamine-6-phosphate deacetylase
MSAKRHAIAASHVFDGVALHRNTAVVIEGAQIVALAPRAVVPTDTPVHALRDGLWLAPGFIDTQVNGGGDVLFNDQPTLEGISTIVAAHRKFGTTALLPTLISDQREKTALAIAAVEAAFGSMPGVLGIHLEGPFLSSERPGVHDPRALRQPTTDDVRKITAPGHGVTLVTLAPEVVPAGFIAELARANVRIALGHSMATYEQTWVAMAEGLTGFTHLFNAMRPLASREPGPIAAALEAPKIWFGMIVDGIHVDPAVLRLALRGLAQPMLVTDAMPPVGGRDAAFTLYDDKIAVRDGRCLRADGALAGSVLDMASAVRNCVDMLGVPLTDALRFASANPANFLGLGERLGKLAPGYRADLVAFDPSNIAVSETWVAGTPAESA